jgi:hypothetical protein
MPLDYDSFVLFVINCSRLIVVLLHWVHWVHCLFVCWSNTCVCFMIKNILIKPEPWNSPCKKCGWLLYFPRLNKYFLHCFLVDVHCSSTLECVSIFDFNGRLLSLVMLSVDCCINELCSVLVDCRMENGGLLFSLHVPCFWSQRLTRWLVEGSGGQATAVQLDDFGSRGTSN